jgi:2-polyprenyl-3-methyl-5-hydroxy-6-metoxy-1,4-benzoquinol methylase
MICPVCRSEQIKKCFTVKDHSVSRKDFLLYECSSCTLRFTVPAPPEEEIGVYYQSPDYISHTDQQKGITGSLYRIVRKWTMNVKVNLVVRFAQKKVGMHLDLGAGTGAFVHAMEKAGWNTIGFEPDEQARKRANKLYKASVYPANDFYQIPDGGYDAITLWHVLEHVHKLQETVQKMSRLLSPKGKVFIAVPNYTSYDAKHYGIHWAAYDVPRHLYHFTPQAMRVLLEKHGLKIISVRPMWFDSFYVSLLSEKYKGGNLLSGFIFGFISNLVALFNRKKCSSLIYVAERIHHEEE